MVIEVKYLHACGMSWKLKQWGQKSFSCAISLLAWHCTSLISNYLMQRACYWFVLAVRAQVQSGDGTGSLPVVFAWLDFCFWYGCQDRAVLYRNIIEAIASLKQYSCRNKLTLGHFKVVYLFILHELEEWFHLSIGMLHYKVITCITVQPIASFGVCHMWDMSQTCHVLC